MFVIGSQKSRAYLDALEAWRYSSGVVSDRWAKFLGADSATRRFAFASYLAALDSEAAAAADVAMLAPRAAA